MCWKELRYQGDVCVSWEKSEIFSTQIPFYIEGDA